MSAKEDIAAIRKALRARGFTGSVRMARGTAYGWIDVTASPNYGPFSERQNAVLREAFGCDAGRSNIFLIAPDHERDRTRLTRSWALQQLGIAAGS